MKKVRFQVIHTSDVHGAVTPNDYASMKEKNQGLAKVSTLLKRVRKPHSLLIDGGDIIQGNPLVYYHQKESMEAVHPMARVMNALHYDYYTIGNHEFNYGIKNLETYIDHSNATLLNSNIMANHVPKWGKPYDIVDIDGLKIGVIGVTTHYIPNWEQPSVIEGLAFLDAYETTKHWVNKIREHVDFLIVNYHGGFERDLETNELLVEDTGENQGWKMLHSIDGIDLLLTGHQHRTLMGHYNKTFYSQPSFNGQLVNEMMIEARYDGAWSFDIQGTHHDLSDVEADLEVLSLIEKTESNTQRFLDQVVGQFDRAYLIDDQLKARLYKHPLVSFINQVQLAYTNADIALCGLGNHVVGFNRKVTIRDILGTYVYPNTLVVKKMTGHTILKALEKTMSFFEVEDDEIVVSKKYTSPKLELYAYDMYDGIEYEADISKPVGSRINWVKRNDQPFDLEQEYTVALNNYRSSGGGDYVFFKACELIQDTTKEIVQLLIDYVVEHPSITIDHHDNIHIKKSS